MGVIAGLATVGFLIFLIILVVYCCCRVRGKRNQESGINEIPDASPYRQTCHPSSPSTAQQIARQENYNPYFMEGGGNIQGQTNFLHNPGTGPGTQFLNPHQSTALYPTTAVGVPHNATVPYPVNLPQGMPMPMPQNYMPVANFPSTAPQSNPSGNDPPPPYHTVVSQNPYQPYKFP